MNGFFIGAIVLDSADKSALADFYAKLLDGEVLESNEHYIQLQLPSRLRLTFQNAEGFMPPVWPEEPGKQQQMTHLDIMVGNLDEAVTIAEQLGAQKADEQFVPGMITMKDPAGHPFCLIPMPKE
ncbi:MAG: VOC family protein [Oscillospiraceae bacterium]